MRVLILNGPLKGDVVDVETRTMIGPKGRVEVFNARGDKGMLRYRVGEAIHNGKKYKVATAIDPKQGFSFQEDFDRALKYNGVSVEGLIY